MRVFFFFFFFSSRRRHTRCSRDWSSDVCSSDLAARPRAPAAPPDSRRRCTGRKPSPRQAPTGRRRSQHAPINALVARQPRQEGRSEEHTSELQSRLHLVCRLLLEKKKKNNKIAN